MDRPTPLGRRRTRRRARARARAAGPACASACSRRSCCSSCWRWSGTGGWFWLRGKAESEIDGWFAREAQAGRRQWTCADRSLTGYPFRFELRCSSLAFARSDVRFTVGPVVAVAQVYSRAT